MASRGMETARLRLEPLVRAHAAALYPLLQDQRIYRFIPQDPPASLEALETRYEKLETRRSPDGREAWLNWAMRLRDEPQFIGRLEATVKPGGTALIAYELSPDFWGKGYATEACTWLLGELTRRQGARVVEVMVDTRNAASIRLLERLAFRRVSFKQNADWFKGESSDEYTYRWTGPEKA